MFHIDYRSTIKSPQHNILFLLSETVFLLITSSKSIFFPAKHHFTFHLISDEFFPIYSEYNLGCRCQGFLGPWLSSTYTASFTKVKTNYLTDVRCLLHRESTQDPHHTLQEVKREIYFIHWHHTLAKSPLTWNTTRNGPCSYTKKKKTKNQHPPLFRTIPPALLKDSPQSIKGISRHLSKGNRKGQP